MRRATLMVCIMTMAACDIPMDISLCPESVPPPEKIVVSIRGNRDTVFVGDTLRLVAEVYSTDGIARYSCEFCCPAGDGVIETPVEWSSSNSRVATVSRGVVVGREPGTVYIIARAPAFRLSTYHPIVVVAESP